MGEVLERVRQCADAIRGKTEFVPRTALILGSGLGSFGEKLQVEHVVEYGEIPGFPVSTVPGHAGRFLFGYVEKEPVVAMQGRVHYYEGYPMEDVVLPTRVMGLLGAKRLVLTNAAGGIGSQLTPGSLMLLTDQISTFVPSPLVGPNEDQLGTRFPDMTQIYSPRLREKALAAARKLNIPLKQGVYVQASGPQYESPAEIRMFQALGADAVGMSTACEAIAARHMGLEVCGISCVTNLAAGLGGKPLSHQEVQEVADRVSQQFQSLVWELLASMEA